MDPTHHSNGAVPEAAPPTFGFTFRKNIVAGQAPALDAFPGDVNAVLTVAMTATEEQALAIAERLYGPAQAAAAIRMSLEFDRLPPELLERVVSDLAEDYSAETGEHWTARADVDIPLAAFADLLELANESYWEHFEKSFPVKMEAMAKRGIDIKDVLRREADPTGG